MEKEGKFILFNNSEFRNWLFTNSFDRDINFIQNHHTFKPNYSHFRENNYFSLLKGMERDHIKRKFAQMIKKLHS